MSIGIVRLGSPREAGEGIRLGTVRRPPRGVPKSEYAKRDFYDVWLPLLSPSEELLKEGKLSVEDWAWAVFKRKYLAEMNRPDPRQVLDLLTAFSHQTHFSLGCYGQNEQRRHRSILRELLLERGAEVV